MIEEVDPNERSSRNPKEVSNSKTPVLDNFARDLNLNLRNMVSLDPVVGRETRN